MTKVENMFLQSCALISLNKLFLTLYVRLSPLLSNHIDLGLTLQQFSAEPGRSMV